MIWFLYPSEYPKGIDIGARQAGINKTKKRSSETKGNNQGKAPKILAACYECQPVSGYPPNVVINSKTKRAICKAGHIIDCSGGCR